MSAQTATRAVPLRPLREPTVRSEPLRLVPAPVAAPERRGRIAFALLLATVLGSGLVALLLLNTLSAQDAFRIGAQSAKLTQLSDTEQALRQQVQAASAPGALAADAARLGMVAAVPGPYVSLPGGALRALLEPAPAPSTMAAGLPAPTASTAAQPSAGATHSAQPVPATGHPVPKSTGKSSAKSASHRGKATTTAPTAAPAGK